MNEKVTPPQISPETMKAMWQFFLKTSIPRLLEEEREKREQRETEQEGS